MLDRCSGAHAAPALGFAPKMGALLAAVVIATTVALVPSVSAEDIVRRPIADGAHAIVKHGRTLGLEVNPPESGGQAFLQRFLALESEWVAYRNRGASFIPYARLKPEVQREIMLAIYTDDTVDETGWHHTVIDSRQTLWSLCEWLTGRGSNYQVVMTDAANVLPDLELEVGQKVLIPTRLLSPVMRRPIERAATPVVQTAESLEAESESVESSADTPPLQVAEVVEEVATPAAAERAARRLRRGQTNAKSDSAPRVIEPPAPQPELAPQQPEPTPAPHIAQVDEADNPFIAFDHDLDYTSDRSGAYALYKLKKGEALYTSVVARFTDYRENADILEACRVIAEKSNIRDVRDIHTGQTVIIPAYMLSDRYQPRDSVARKEFEQVIQEAERLAKTRPVARDLAGVVVILDPGHGGSDHGAAYPPIYEDEVNYDIVCRIKRLLDATDAKVYVTLRDRSSGYEPTDARIFAHDTDEEITTNPPYPLTDNAKVGLNLRWMLANSIYAKETKAGTDSRKIIFTSVHTDALYNQSSRGAMIYIPGAKLRRGEERQTAAVYARYEEGRGFNTFRSNHADLLRDEALSRNFANVVMQKLGEHRIKRHDHGDPIRSQIRRSADSVWVPAVLRNNDVPTKILLETANLTNATDRARLSDPWWREQFAQAYVNALRAYFDTVTPTMTAAAGQ
jgi:N-acetylmuramoyl-L-alanine amidase